MKKSFPDMIISIVLLAFLTSLAVQAPSIPSVSRGYPVFLLVVCFAMTIFMLINSVRKLKFEDPQKTQLKEQFLVIFPYCLLVAAYLFLMTRIGYILSTIAFMIISLLYLRLKNKVVMILLSLIMTVAIYFIFTRFLTVILPKGTWITFAF